MLLPMLFFSLAASMAPAVDTDSGTNFEFDGYEDITVKTSITPPEVISVKPTKNSLRLEPFTVQKDDVPEQFNPYPNPQEINTFLSPSQGFNFTVNCLGIDPKICLSTTTVLESAGHLIATDIKLRKPIQVYVTFRNMNLRDMGIFAPSILVNSTALYPAKRVGESNEFSYPQSVLKQSYVPHEIVYRDYDMMMEIPQSKLWSFDLAAKEISRYKYDFLCTDC